MINSLTLFISHKYVHMTPLTYVRCHFMLYVFTVLPGCVWCTSKPFIIGKFNIVGMFESFFLWYDSSGWLHIKIISKDFRHKLAELLGSTVYEMLFQIDYRHINHFKGLLTLFTIKVAKLLSSTVCIRYTVW